MSFVRQPAPLGLGMPFYVLKERLEMIRLLLLADDFIVGDKKGVTSDLVNSFKK